VQLVAFIVHQALVVRQNSLVEEVNKDFLTVTKPEQEEPLELDLIQAVVIDLWR